MQGTPVASLVLFFFPRSHARGNFMVSRIHLCFLISRHSFTAIPVKCFACLFLHIHLQCQHRIVNLQDSVKPFYSYLKYPIDFFTFPFFLVAWYSVYELFPFIPFNPSPLSPKKSVIAATVDIGNALEYQILLNLG